MFYIISNIQSLYLVSPCCLYRQRQRPAGGEMCETRGASAMYIILFINMCIYTYCLFIYIYIYTHTYIYIYIYIYYSFIHMYCLYTLFIYIYIERERYRYRCVSICLSINSLLVVFTFPSGGETYETRGDLNIVHEHPRCLR